MAVIAGAGPVGALCAIYLADQGWAVQVPVCNCLLRLSLSKCARHGVQVFEKDSAPSERPDQDDSKAYVRSSQQRCPPRQSIVSPPCAQMLSLTGRGVNACYAAGVDLKPVAAASQGAAEFLHVDKRGGVLRQMRFPVDADKPRAIILYRAELALHLAREAQRLHPESISFHYAESVTGVNLDGQTVTVSSAGSTPQVSSLAEQAQCSC